MKTTIESENPCPKCGAKQWWLPSGGANFLTGKDKVLVVSYCGKCHTWFKTEHKLVKLVGRSDRSMKVAVDRPRKFSNWQLFSHDCLAAGKTLKEASHLYWKEWQTNHKWPTSLASITLTGEENKKQ